MQVLESEIVIPLAYRSRTKTWFPPIGTLVFLVFFFIIWIGEGLWLAAGASRFPDIQQNFHQGMIIGSVVFVVILILYGLVFAFRTRQKHTSPPYVRINHEGIFTSRDSLLIKWAEIKALSPATFLGTPYLQVVPWNLAEVASRAKRSSGRFLRFGIHLTLLLFGRMKSPATIGISQMALPISIGELLAAIQEHFAPELLEHRITVGRSQP